MITQKPPDVIPEKPAPATEHEALAERIPFAAPAPLDAEPVGRSRKWVWFVVIVAIGVGIYAYVRHGQTTASTQPTTEPAAANARGIPVVGIAARRGNMLIYLNGLGAVSPLATVTVHTRVDGELQEIDFEEGQLVKEGQQIALIDPRPFQAQLAQAQGQLEKDQAALKNAQLELERDKQAAEAIPKQTVDTQQATVDEAQGALKVDQGQIDNINLQLTYCKITAAVTGRIGLRLVDKGNIVHANDANGIAVITQLQPIAVIFSISEDDLHAVLQNPNRGVGLAADAYDRSFSRKLASGTLTAIDNQVDPTTGTLRLKATFPNDDNALFPSEFVNVRLHVNTIREGVIVPVSAVQRGPDGAFAYVVKNEVVEVRQIVPGVTEGEEMLIASGVAPGEIVVTDGVDRLQAGSKVSVRPPGGATTRPGGAHAATTATTKSTAIQ